LSHKRKSAVLSSLKNAGVPNCFQQEIPQIEQPVAQVTG